MKRPTLFKDYFSERKPYKGGASANSKNGQKVYKLSSNENFLGCSPLVSEAIEKEFGNLHIYPSPSDIAFRTAIANDLGDYFSPDHIVTANGGVNLIQLIIQAFMGEGLECIAPYPSFTPYFGMPSHMGGRVVKVPLHSSDWSLDVPAILNAITDRTRLIWLASPNNPTGSIIHQEELDNIISAVPDHVLVIYDEVYRQYVTEPTYAQARKDILAGKNVLALNSFSKAYGLAGLRIGYAYTNLDVASYFRNYMRPFMVNTLSQKAAIAALQDHDFISKVASQTNIEKEFIYQQFEKLGIRYWPSHGNFIFVNPDQSEEAFICNLLKYGIMVRGGSDFEAPGYIRITVGDREANEALIRAISSLGVTTQSLEPVIEN